MTATSAPALRSLDLLRAYAIASVVLAHACLAYGVGPALAPLQLGGTGVDLFFLLSGWLLGTQLLTELRDTGTIRLRRFLSRRWLRTLPAYYAVLIPTTIQQVAKGTGAVEWPYPVFLQNYVGHLPYFYVSWSLCVEEHFYLFIGPVLLLLAAWGRWGTPVAAALLVLPATCRALGLYGDLIQTHVRFDECLAGVALAAVCVLWPRGWARLCAHAWWIGLASLALFAWFVWSRWHPAYALRLNEPSLCIAMFGGLLLFAVSSERRTRAMYVPGATYVARRAYSVYLLHPDVLFLLKRLQIGSFPVFLLAGVAATLVAAELLYRLIERPLMEARERYAFSASRRATLGGA